MTDKEKQVLAEACKLVDETIFAISQCLVNIGLSVEEATDIFMGAYEWVLKNVQENEFLQDPGYQFLGDYKAPPPPSPGINEAHSSRIRAIKQEEKQGGVHKQVLIDGDLVNMIHQNGSVIIGITFKLLETINSGCSDVVICQHISHVDGQLQDLLGVTLKEAHALSDLLVGLAKDGKITIGGVEL